MNKITFEEYKSAIREKYVLEKREDVSGILLNPTPAQLRNLCLMIFENGLNTTDQNILRIFFNLKGEDSLRKSIENCDIGKFKPIISFLKREKDSDHVTRIELAAVLVDFNPRPYSKYLQIGKTELVGDSRDFLLEEKPTKHNLLRKTSSTKTLIIDYNSKSKKTIGISFVVLLSFIFMGYSAKGIFFPNKECMQWNENHYEEVDCSNNQISIGQLNTTLPLDENVMSLKKIDPNQKISFFKNDKAIVWYSKQNGIIVLFNGPGFHPETAKPLKPITKYIIEKYNLKK